MNLDSVRGLKSEISAEVIAQAGESPDARSFYAATEPPMPSRGALGVAIKDGEHLLAVRTESPAFAMEMSNRANGEVDIKFIRVEKRVSIGELQGRRRPLEPGVQLNIRGAPFVGTLGAFVRDAGGRLFGLSNSHVIADTGKTPIGTVIGQPFGDSAIGVLYSHIPFSPVAPNLVDCALMRLDNTEALVDGWNAAFGGRLLGAREIVAGDLGKKVTKVGRTTGTRNGLITAVEIDGLSVNYGDRILRFNDQIEVSGGPSTNFSSGGDSGSLIVDQNGWAVALLFAGGVDSMGEDQTYGNRVVNCLSMLGVTLAV